MKCFWTLGLLLLCAMQTRARAQSVDIQTPSTALQPAASANSATTDAAWSQALDALVAGEQSRALEALSTVAASTDASAERRATARDLIVRIQRRHTTVPPIGAGPNPSSTAPVGASTSAPTPTPIPPVSSDDDRAGRTMLLGATTLAGVALWGWTLPTTLDIKSNRGFIGMYMLTAGASFGAPFLLTRTGPATWGMANMTWLGASRGALVGFGVGTLIRGADGSNQGLAASLLTGSVLGAVGGALWGRSADMTAGAAHAIGLAGDIGTLAGLAFANLTGLDQHDKSEVEQSNNKDLAARMLALCALGGGGLGYLGGHLWASDRALTWGDVEAMRLPIAIGSVAGATIVDWTNTGSSRAIVGASLVGGIGGIVSGERLVREKDYAVGQGFLLDLSTLSGALASMGTVYLISGSNRSEVYLTSGVLGAAAGFTALYLTLDAPAMRRLAARLTPRGNTSSRVSLTPYLGPNSTRGLVLVGAF